MIVFFYVLLQSSLNKLQHDALQVGLPCLSHVLICFVFESIEEELSHFGVKLLQSNVSSLRH